MTIAIHLVASGGHLRYLHPLSDPEQSTRGGERQKALTSRRFEYGDFTIFQTSVQGLHKLQLNLVRSKWMMEILRVHAHVRHVRVHGAGLWRSARSVGKSREIKIKRWVEPVRLQERHAVLQCGNPQGKWRLGLSGSFRVLCTQCTTSKYGVFQVTRGPHGIIRAEAGV
jgi:hypothetical protein